MARIFISYSRVDIEITERLVDRLRRIFGYEQVWYDDNLHGGDQWWLEIIRQIAVCDVFIYLLSNESVTSPYCLAEFEEARRLQKRIITVQVRDRTRIPDEMDDIQYVNMATGITDDGLARLAGSINKQAGLARKQRPLWQPPTPRPHVPKHEARSEATDAVDTPTLNIPTPAVAPPKPRLPIFALLALVIVLLGLAAFAFYLAGQNQTVTSTLPPTTAIAQQATDAPTLAADGFQAPSSNMPSDTPTTRPTPTSSETPPPTETPAPTLTPIPTLSATDEEATISANMLLIQTEQAQAATAAAIAEAQTAAAIMQATADALTATATLWTPTFTPDLRATAAARVVTL